MKLLGNNCLRLRFHKELHVNLMWGQLEKNQHGTQKPGEQWNRETICGPKFATHKLTVHAPSTARRFWFYFPSGKCWWLDFYFDRRPGLTDRWVPSED